MLIRIRKKGNIIYLYCDKIYDRFMIGLCQLWWSVTVKQDRICYGFL